MRTRLYVLSSMLHELQDNRLEVVLLPQYHPTNPGACIRVAVGHNCEWYRQLCADFESRRKTHYKKFKTKVKRQRIETILMRMLSGEEVTGVYADWIRKYAEALDKELDEVIPF